MASYEFQLNNFQEEKKDKMKILNDKIFSEKGITNIVGSYLGDKPVVDERDFVKLLSQLALLSPSQAEQAGKVLLNTNLVIMDEFMSQTDIVEHLLDTEIEDEDGSVIEVKTEFTDEEMKEILKEVSDGDIQSIMDEFDTDSFLQCSLYLLERLVKTEGTKCHEIIVIKEENDSDDE